MGLVGFGDTLFHASPLTEKQELPFKKCKVEKVNQLLFALREIASLHQPEFESQATFWFGKIIISFDLALGQQMNAPMMLADLPAMVRSILQQLQNGELSLSKEHACEIASHLELIKSKMSRNRYEYEEDKSRVLQEISQISQILLRPRQEDVEQALNTGHEALLQIRQQYKEAIPELEKEVQAIFIKVQNQPQARHYLETLYALGYRDAIVQGNAQSLMDHFAKSMALGFDPGTLLEKACSDLAQETRMHAVEHLYLYYCLFALGQNNSDLLRTCLTKLLEANHTITEIAAIVKGHLGDNADQIHLLDREIQQLEEQEKNSLKGRIKAGDYQKIQELVHNGGQSVIIELKDELVHLKAQNDQSPHVLLLERALASMDALRPLIRQRELAGKVMRDAELFHICLHMEIEFEKTDIRTGFLYLPNGTHGLPRAILIDFQTRSFFVFSKKAGRLQKKGGMRKITDAIEIQRGLVPQAKRWARAVNQRGIPLTTKEVTYEKKYGDIRCYTTYVTSKNGPPCEKTLLLMEAYETDLHPFTESKMLNEASLFTVMRHISGKIAQMHHDKVIHRDLKPANILYRVNPATGKEEVKVSDFGLTQAPMTESDSLPIFHSYGTPTFTSPDRLFKQSVVPNSPEERLVEGKRDDIFAVGCILYELLTKSKIPWGNDTNAYWKHSDQEAGKRAQHSFNQTLITLQKKANMAFSPGMKKLYHLCIALLQKRLTAEELAAELQFLAAGTKVG